MNDLLENIQIEFAKRAELINHKRVAVLDWTQFSIVANYFYKLGAGLHENIIT